MHIFFSGIGGHAIGPLALIAKQAGYEVSGSDKQESSETKHLQEQGIQLHIGQSEEQIATVHANQSIDWLVYSSAVVRSNPNHPEIQFAKKHGIKHGKRDELLNAIIDDHNLKLIAIAGTHGKTTTTAMAVWLFRQLGMPLSYSVGAEIGFGPMGQFDGDSEYFVYECDEFDRNFLAFHPYMSLITGIAWDHHEVFPTREDYNQAFRDFIAQSKQLVIWEGERELLGLHENDDCLVIKEDDPAIDQIELHGLVNRQDAWQVVQAVHKLTKRPIAELIQHMNQFPGLKQRMERLAPNLYTNYAHTPEKIKGGMNAALEIAADNNQDIVIIYEPLTNRRQHYIKDEYKDCFTGAKKIYWVPTYLAREDPDLPVLKPEDLIPSLADPSIAEPAKLDDDLLAAIRSHLQKGDMVVAMGANGANSLDEWLRQRFL
ncbi:MAG: Mur ligase domain-containing protein [Candidatus Saccharimonadales bacterium]